MSSAVMIPEEKLLDVLQRLLGRDAAVTCCTYSIQTVSLTDEPESSMGVMLSAVEEPAL